ncbi:hypothetical protein KORDIASMS9_02710 [Kordia sp. SMS9]|uniref:hypothetical protein n=1 Tax=Kordia sp. SMS9 TaxID=2282170 RepID=UPI000E10658C|nr:hypothetical protein [Kordia sp. SMS9]AXG70470.1 hypothetical protein KORDIASMS9_02710 [Kordia sp. SMS9]
MRNLLLLVAATLLVLTSVTSCTPTSIAEETENYDTTFAIDKEEVEDPGDRGN